MRRWRLRRLSRRWLAAREDDIQVGRVIATAEVLISEPVILPPLGTIHVGKRDRP